MSLRVLVVDDEPPARDRLRSMLQETEGFEVADQKRVVTPVQALGDGASVLVIGRPITAAANPAKAIADIVESLSPSQPKSRVVV